MNATHTSLDKLLSLKGSLTLITGAAMGIGEAIANRYAEAGSDLILLDRDETALEKTAAHIETTYGVEVTAVVVDLSDVAAIESCLDGLTRMPNILVNNAGVYYKTKLEKLTPEAYHKMLSINTTAVVFLTKGVIARRGDAGGVIVNISSLEGVRGMTPDMIVYGVSKAGVLAAGRAVAHDYAKKGWRANTILPGGINTPGARNMGIAALKKLDFSMLITGFKFSSRLPAGKLGTPDDVARVALFLGSPMSDYMNGAEVPVDGGFLAS